MSQPLKPFQLSGLLNTAASLISKSRAVKKSQDDRNSRLDELEKKIATIDRFQHASASEQQATISDIHRLLTEYSSSPIDTPEAFHNMLDIVMTSLRRERERLCSSIFPLLDLPKELVLQVALHTDIKTYQKLFLLCRETHITLKDTQSFNPDLPDAIGMIQRRSDFYNHFSPALRMNSDVLKALILQYPNKIFELPLPIENDEQYRSLFNLLKQVAYLTAKSFGMTNVCQRLELEEPGFDTIIPELRSTRLPIDLESLMPTPFVRHIALALIAIDPVYSAKLVSLFPDDREVVVAAVTQNGMALEHASDELKNDERVVVAAVTQNGRALEHASDELKDNEKVVLASFNQGGDPIRFASLRLQADKNMQKAAKWATHRWILSVISCEEEPLQWGNTPCTIS